MQIPLLAHQVGDREHELADLRVRCRATVRSHRSRSHPQNALASAAIAATSARRVG